MYIQKTNKQAQQQRTVRMFWWTGSRVEIQFSVEMINRRKDNFSGPTVQFVITAMKLKGIER